MSRGSQLFLFQSSQLFLSRGSQVSVSRGSQVSVSPGSQVSVSWGFQVFVSRGSQVSVSPGSQVSLQHCGVAAAGSAPGPRSRWHSAGGHSRFPVEFPIPAFPLSSHPPINACDWDQTRPVSVRRVPVLQGAHTCECPYHRCARTAGVPAHPSANRNLRWRVIPAPSRYRIKSTKLHDAKSIKSPKQQN